MIQYLDINSCRECNKVGESQQIFLTIKGFNRLDVRQRIAQRKAGLPETTNSNIPPIGAVLKIPLYLDRLDEAHAEKYLLFKCKNPYEYKECAGFHFFVNSVSASKYLNGQTTSFSHTLFVRGHSIDYSSRLNQFVVASSGYDLLYFLDYDLNLISIVSIWEIIGAIDGTNYLIHGFNEHLFQKFNSYTTINPLDHTNGLNVTNSPFYTTCVRFGYDDEILFSGYNDGSLYIIRGCELIKKELQVQGPHCFEKIVTRHACYSVTDSGRGRVLQLNSDFEVVRIIDISTGCRCDNEKEGGEGEWAQFSCYLDSDFSLLTIIDAKRSCIYIIDLIQSKYKSIRFPKNWNIHGVSPVLSE